MTSSTNITMHNVTKIVQHKSHTVTDVDWRKFVITDANGTKLILNLCADNPFHLIVEETDEVY